MNPILILAATATLGVEVGWQPLAEGGHEYTIQLEPQLLDVLKRGNDIVSEVPPQLDIRRYRVTVGTGRLARVDGQPPHVAQPEQHAPKTPSDDTPHAQADTAVAATGQPTPADPSADRGKTSTATHAQQNADHGASPPAELPGEHADVKPLDAQPASHHEPAETHNTEKPAIDEPQRPWLPFSIALVLLCCSLGGNVYLGMVAAEARKRYRQVAARLRGATP
jgi:hypothetical protein